MKLVLGYIKKESFIHNLTGATKLLCFTLWCISTIMTYDTRILMLMILFGLYLFKVAKLKLKDVSFAILLIMFFLLLNNIFIYIFSPDIGNEIYGSKTILLHVFGPYSITLEQLFYQLNITLKYFSVIPLALIFVLTTNPSEFASSLNKIGVSYKISYAVSLSLRYIPDVMSDYKNISLSKQARGIDLSKNERIHKKIKNSILILIPIIFSSIDKIEKISCAMELRAFGYSKKRTWYTYKNFKLQDIISITIFVFIMLISIIFLFINNGRFFNPFL